MKQIKIAKINFDMKFSFALLFISLISCSADTPLSNTHETYEMNSGDTLIETNKLLGKDYRLFQNSSLWSFAQAVKKEDVIEMHRIVTEDSIDLNYQEPKYGNTLLMLTIINHQYLACKTLLELGADVNIHNHYAGQSAIIMAVQYPGALEDSTRFLKLILKYGSSPNDTETGPRPSEHRVRNTPLLIACAIGYAQSPSISRVKLLVEAGANVNYVDNGVAFPLKAALISNNYDVALLLLEHGARYDIPMGNNDDKDLFILDILRKAVFPLGSKEHLNKMAVVEFLKTKGLNYTKTPVPDYIKEKIKKDYPGNWREYLKKY